jgi:hypothetical protein
MGEHRSLWNNILTETAEPIIGGYFRGLGLAETDLPRVKVYEAFPGSWIIEAAVIMVTSVGTAYILLKGVSELPKIAEGLTEVKQRLKTEFHRKCSAAIEHELIENAERLDRKSVV